MSTSSYIIRGGIEGFERLKILSRVMFPTTAALFDRVGIQRGVRALDVGCGSGDVALEIARRIGHEGHVVGVDLDEVKLDLARREASASKIAHIEFVQSDLHSLALNAFDLQYARFFLTHMRDPALSLRKLFSMLRPGGMLVVEDIDFTGSVCHPENRAHAKYVELYTKTVQSKGADPNIGPRLASLLSGAGFANVQLNVVQPLAMSGEAPLMPALTVRNIAQSVIAAGLAVQSELEAMEHELIALAEAGETLMGCPRVFQVWGRRP